ncbi:cupin-like domain-containing protein [Pseudoduganella namucuonensis]|uniref:Cupin-like domain-containing protein n=1 Tax=Pseudoduganella namucuonensis TaxID=1035707 RepID=A0A1I7I7I3_9BURK|nr:cupin-like domain-containing protein [Pseudoduganella namucuonensis]SFU68899.1 Cupin-like domain-containing protein [Pseudoduganella namucuonensis]
MTIQLSRAAETRSIDPAMDLAGLVAANQPLILRGLVRHWPAVRHGARSPEALARYLMGFDRGGESDTVLMPPEARGRLFYADDMRGFNFMRAKRSVSAVLEQVARYSMFPAAPAVAMQSALLDDCLPGFAADNPMPLVEAAARPRLWLGNEVVTPAHFDESHNLACVVSGRRRFTLFPPEQAANLHIGPLDFAPTPTPISMVSFRAPDFGRFPRFRAALQAAQVAELEPGDALYIPTLWWHHVESIGVLNTMVNYWWTAPAANGLDKARVLAMAVPHNHTNA